MAQDKGTAKGHSQGKPHEASQFESCIQRGSGVLNVPIEQIQTFVAKMLRCVAEKGSPGMGMQARARNLAWQDGHGVHSRPSPAWTGVHRPSLKSSFNYCRNRSLQGVFSSTGNGHVGLQRNSRGKRHIAFNNTADAAHLVDALDESDGDDTTSAVGEPGTDAVGTPKNGRLQALALDFSETRSHDRGGDFEAWSALSQ